ncbi:DUF2865 domain-containing protein [Tardiphaga alba]|uniref:DUF2865 domain-containing protein n=1 Tax=Tardiphaga alba TaxID=340268 RepID=A0ABX8AC46_9BRAD|nr:DUF2865 domain-containing protein [Tardiphaga alba]
MSEPVTATLSRWAIICAALVGVTASNGDAVAQGAPPYPAQVYPPGQAQQQQSANPMCGRLEAQLSSIDRGNGLDPARADQIRRYEDSVSRQQSELDRVTQQARRMGCDSSGFFSLFSGQSAQCGPVNNQIQQMRGNLDQMTTSLERLRVGTPGSSDRDSQRRSVLLALAQNNCGPQYAAAARQQQQNSGPGGFLSNLFGNNESSPGDIPSGGDMMSAVPQGTFRTVCVRTCDGFYFPISFTTIPARFADDERACKAQCPASDANLYTYRNPGEDMNAAVSISGQPYSSSPNAFKYRTEFNPSCSCKAQGQTWSDALKNIDDKAAAQAAGDVIVTEERAKQMSQPQKGTPAALKKNAAPAQAAPAATPAQPAAPGNPGQIRQVGPQFLPNNTKQ